MNAHSKEWIQEQNKISESLLTFKPKKITASKKWFASVITQKQFESELARKHLDSLSFLTSVRNSVGKQSFYKSRPKVREYSHEKFIGLTTASIETRKQAAYVDANRALLHVDETLTIQDLNLSWDDDSIKNWAAIRAEKCAKLISNDFFAVHVLRWIVNEYGLKWPAYDLFGDEAAVLRCCDEKWWRRKARVLKVRAIDQLARGFRMVHAKAQTYTSNEAVRLRRIQARRNRSVLEGFEAVNQEGDTYTLAELADLSVSNPTNRRHELMVRMRGFEQVAEQFGHEGLFITMSCPSWFHPMKQIKNNRGRLVRVIENKNYLDFNPRDAQEWLCKTWAMIRAELARQDIKCYGFRVVEPHHDGCPHWHQLLFFHHSQLREAELIFKRYILRTATFEPGSDHRLKVVKIDKEKGSAAGYIAKYICKSIDGSHVNDDLLGNAGSDAAERICAWASSWGIRQFQQIGGPSVTVWRELRKLDDEEDFDSVVESARAAADASDWAAYFLVQSDGLPFVSRSTSQIRTAYWLEHDSQTGEVFDEDFNKYREQSQGRIFGVSLFAYCEQVEKFISTGVHVLTRFYRWTVQRLGTAAREIKKALPVTTLSADELLDLLRGDGFGSTA